MNTTLPRRLRNEPLLEALFECRFTAHLPVSSILPGIIFSEFDREEKQLERLVESQIPESIRNNDPNLQYAPLVRLRLQNYMVLIGDCSIAIACNLPYRGWNDFKSIIIRIVKLINKSKLINKITRYSVKYADLIQSSDPADQATLANLTLRIGSHSLIKESYQVRMDVPVDGFINVIQIISGVKATKPDKTILEGVLITTDTIKNADNIPIEQLEQGFDDALDRIHCVNKKVFFDCLTEQTLMRLGPEYE